MAHQEALAVVALLKDCAKRKDLRKGARVHEVILRNGLLKRESFIERALVSMYSKCGALTKAHELFLRLSLRDTISWNAMIAGYVEYGPGENALTCFEQMQQEGAFPNSVSFICVLKVCGSFSATEKDEQFHIGILRQGLLENSIALGSALVDMYSKCGAFIRAQQVLDELPVRNVVSWSALISGYVQGGLYKEALNCFDKMQQEGHSPDALAFSIILRACGSIGLVEKGEAVHAEISKQGFFGGSILLGNALVSMYTKCGALEKAQQVLDELSAWDAVTWSTLITGYIQHGQGEEALKCFEKMQQEGLYPDTVTYICMLKACGMVGAANKGELIHDEVVRQGLLAKSVILGSALIDMYVKCCELTKAKKVLEELPVRNISSWNALIGGFAQQGMGEEALDCFDQMQHDGISFDAFTLTCLLKASGSVGMIEKGEQLLRQGLLEKNIVLGNALVDMYVKCGVLPKAHRALEELPARNVVSWSTLITGYAQQGQSGEVMDRLERMQSEGHTPDSVTFACLLNACSHSGQLEEGQMYFTNMCKRYAVIPDVEHYACMIDLFGRAGNFNNALQVMKKLPSDYLPAWSALLAACRKWGNAKLGRWAFERAIEVDVSDDAAYYACMTGVYAAAGMHKEASEIEAMRIMNKIWAI